MIYTAVKCLRDIIKAKFPSHWGRVLWMIMTDWWCVNMAQWDSRSANNISSITSHTEIWDMRGKKKTFSSKYIFGNGDRKTLIFNLLLKMVARYLFHVLKSDLYFSWIWNLMVMCMISKQKRTSLILNDWWSLRGHNDSAVAPKTTKSQRSCDAASINNTTGKIH